MIAKLKGVIDSVGDDWLVIDVNGVGYLVFCSGRTLSRVPKAGEACCLLIDTHVREDHIHLYGFLETAERDWFRLLTTVQGVGAKVALAIQAVLSSNDLIHAIAAQDKKALTQANGVGPKVATRILNELKDKTGSLGLSASEPPASSGATAPAAFGGVVMEAASALVNLGYNRSEALAAVSKAQQQLGEEADLQALIRTGLGELSKF